jgi:hypothetical protein
MANETAGAGDIPTGRFRFFESYNRRAPAATMFELFTAPAGTGLVPADQIKPTAQNRFSQPDGAIPHLVFHRVDVPEKHQPGFTVPADVPISTCSVPPESRAVSVAEVEQGAMTASRRNISLHGAEFLSRFTVQDGCKAVFHYIAEAPFGIHEKITGIAIPVMLDHDIRFTFFKPGTGRQSTVNQVDQDISEKPYRHVGKPVLVPSIKEPAIKLAEFPAVNRIRQCLPRFLIDFKTGYKLEIIEIVSAHEVIQPIRLPNVFIMHQGENIEINPARPHAVNHIHYPLKRAFAVSVDAVRVMDILRSVEAYSHQETVVAKKAKPVVVKQHAVRLEQVLDLLTRPGVFSLQFNGIPEKIDTHQRWFAALPAERNPPGAGRHGGFDEHVQDVVFHERRRLFVNTGDPPVKTVRALEVTAVRRRFQEQ